MPFADRGAATLRPSVGGRFIFVGDRKLWVRGVTYGTFRSDPSGSEYAQDHVERDLETRPGDGAALHWKLDDDNTASTPSMSAHRATSRLGTGE